MDIGVIAHSLTHAGGAERLLVETIKSLKSKGHTISLYLSEWSIDFINANFSQDVTITKLPNFSSINERFVLSTVNIERYLKRHDVYFSSSFPVCNLNIAPLVAYPHEPFRLNHDLKHEIIFWEDSQVRIIEEYTRSRNTGPIPSKVMTNEELEIYAVPDRHRNNQPTIVLSNSIQNLRYLKEVYNFNKIEVLYPGANYIDVPRWDCSQWWAEDVRNNQCQRKFRIIALGSIAYLKRWRLLLDVISVMDCVELYLVGSGPESAYPQIFCDQLSISDRVVILNDISDEELNYLWKSMDACVMCSIREPFGIVAMEAASRGVPCIIDQDSGAYELLREACIKIDGSLTSIVQAISELMNCPDLYEELSREARNIASKYTWNKFGELVEDHLINAIKIEKSKNKSKKIKKDNKIVSFRVDYPFSDKSKFFQFLPMFGRYASSEGWVIERQLTEISDLGFCNIGFIVNAQCNVNYGELMRAMQRVVLISQEKNLEMSFSIIFQQQKMANLSIVNAFTKFWINHINQKKVTDSKNNIVFFFMDCCHSLIRSVQGSVSGVTFIDFDDKYQNVKFNNVATISGCEELKNLFDTSVHSDGWMCIHSYNDYQSSFYFEKQIEDGVSKGKNLLQNSNFQLLKHIDKIVSNSQEIALPGSWILSSGNHGEISLKPAALTNDDQKFIGAHSHKIILVQSLKGISPFIIQRTKIPSVSNNTCLMLSFWGRGDDFLQCEIIFHAVDKFEKTMVGKNLVKPMFLSSQWIKYCMEINIDALGLNAHNHLIYSVGVVLPSDKLFNIEFSNFQLEYGNFFTEFECGSHYENIINARKSEI